MRFRIRTVVVLLVAALATQALAGVDVTIHRPPPGQLRIEHLWRVGLNNRDTITYTVYLHGFVLRGPGYDTVLRAFTNEFPLPPGRKSIRTSDVRVRDVWHRKGYEGFTTRSGMVPEGEYRYCVRVLNADGGGELGMKCLNVKVSFPTRPRLIAPRDGAVVTTPRPLFRWILGMFLGVRPTTRLTVAEVMKGQSPEEAIRSNRAWFRKAGIKPGVFRYPVGARRLEPGRTYAWCIEAVHEASGIVLVKSEVRTFLMSDVSIGPAPQLLTRDEAIKIVLDSVIGQRPPDDVLAFMGRELLKAGDEVREEWPGAKPYEVSEPTWFAWVWDDPAAEFANVTRYAFVSALDGSFEALEREWWPLVNEEVVWQTREELIGDRYVFYSTIDEK